MSTDSIIANMNALDIDEEKKKQREKYKTDMQADIDLSNAGYDSQISSTQNYYNKQIDDAKISYDSEYQKNAVQKLINEKQVAEKMANLGLTDSGLNRTQQTAVQLSYANQKGKIDLARQSALDSLSLAMTDAITTLQNQKAADARNITKQWNDYADTQAQNIYNTQYNGYVDMYNAQVDADAEVQKAAIEAAAKKPTVSYGAGGTSTGGYIVSSPTGTLARDYSGWLKDNGVSTVYNYSKDGKMTSVTYTDSNSGISATFDAGVNPYTGKMSKDVKDEDGYYDPSKAYDNGYQPNNINGKKLKGTDATWIVNDREQKVFTIESDKNSGYYVWRGDIGEYQKLTAEEAAKVGLY